MEGSRKRKVLSDCTNRSIDRTSSSKRPFKSSFSSAINKLLGKKDGETVIKSNYKPGSSSIDENSYEVTTQKSGSVAASTTSGPKKHSLVLGTREPPISTARSVNIRKRAADKRKSEGKEIAEPLTHTSVRKSEGKEITEPLTHTPARKSKGKETAEPLTHTPGRKSKGKEIAEPLTHTHASKSKGKEIVEPLTHTHASKSKGKEIAEPLTHTHARKSKGKEIAEPLTDAPARKSKGKEIAEPLTHAPAVGAMTVGRYKGNNKKDTETGLTKSCTARLEKKKKDNSKYTVPQDYIDKQRAYFAEIDAFELPEEEVNSIDELD